MASVYARWMNAWEYRLATRDQNRLVRPFEWGLEWLGLNPESPVPLADALSASACAVKESDNFFSYVPPADCILQGGHLTFTSALETPHHENNTVHADFFPTVRSRGRAVVVLPQWNADSGGHIGVCKLLNHFGVTALRMNLAYHDRRMPAETARADYHVSSNVGRTVHAGRQSVIDVRCCLDWLEGQGYTRLGILGTSLGSCIAFIAAVHDPRIRVAVLNHVSTWFADVVWTGLSTRHVRAGFGDRITRDNLRRCWAPISPASYLDRLAGRDLQSLLIWARYDTTFLPEFSRGVVEAFRKQGARHEVLCLPCGHYTTGQLPFNIIDGVSMCRFAARRL